MVFVKYVLVVITIIMSIMMLVVICRVKNWCFTILGLLALLYPLGKAVQFWLIWPSWIRWHMADVGFIPAGALAAGLIGSTYFGHTFLERTKKGAGTLFRIAIMVEGAQLLLIPQAKVGHIFRTAGDWVDMVIFFVMFGVTKLLVEGLPQEKPAPETVLPKLARRRAHVQQ